MTRMRRRAAAAGRGIRNVVALFRRHLPHGAAELALAGGARVWPDLSDDFRTALVLAAIAAFAGSFVVEAEYQSRRERRRIARAVASSAARQLRVVELSAPDVVETFARSRRTVTLADVGRGEQDRRRWMAASRRVRDRPRDSRGCAGAIRCDD